MAQAATAAGSTMTAVSLVATARPAATPASAGQARPPALDAGGGDPTAVVGAGGRPLSATRPTAITNARVKQANSDSWMNIRE